MCPRLVSRSAMLLWQARQMYSTTSPSPLGLNSLKPDPLGNTGELTVIPLSWPLGLNTGTTGVSHPGLRCYSWSYLSTKQQASREVDGAEELFIRRYPFPFSLFSSRP